MQCHPAPGRTDPVPVAVQQSTVRHVAGVVVQGLATISAPFGLIVPLPEKLVDVRPGFVCLLRARTLDALFEFGHHSSDICGRPIEASGH